MSVRSRALAALLLLQLGGLAAEAQQQQQSKSPQKAASGRKSRSLMFAALGAVAGAAVSGVYAFTENENSSPGECTSGNCVLTVATVSGMVVGFMIGKESDQLHGLRYRGGVPLYPKSDAVGLNGEAFVLTVRDTIIAVGGRTGVQIISNGSSLKLAERRAGGIRGITSVDIVPGIGSVALGSPSGFYLYPPRSGPGALLREGETAALVSSAERIYFSTDTRIEAAPFSADTLRTWPGVDIGGRAISLAYDDTRALLWAVTDTMLMSFRPEGDSLAAVARLRLPARARMVTVSEHHVAVALGENGVALYDATDAAAPRERGRWTGSRFVYSVAIAGERIFAAAGLDGVYVLSITPTGLETFGLARELGFATLLVSRGAHTFLVDRSTNSLRRFPSDF